MKPGYKTTEFWLALIATLVGALMTSGAVLETSLVGKICGTILMVLSTLGYTAQRASLKKGTTTPE